MRARSSLRRSPPHGPLDVRCAQAAFGFVPAVRLNRLVSAFPRACAGEGKPSDRSIAIWAFRSWRAAFEGPSRGSETYARTDVGHSLESLHPVSLSLFDCLRADAVAVLDAVDQWQGATRDDFVFILAVATERDLRFDAFQRAFTGRVFVTGAVLASVEEPGAHGWRVVVAFGCVLFGFPFGALVGFPLRFCSMYLFCLLLAFSRFLGVFGCFFPPALSDFVCFGLAGVATFRPFKSFRALQLRLPMNGFLVLLNLSRLPVCGCGAATPSDGECGDKHDPTGGDVSVSSEPPSRL
jgi:hypothetical protein